MLNDNLFYKKISTSFAKTGLDKKVLNSIKNKNEDTDFIIAGLQISDQYLKNDMIKHTSFYAMQPVVRLNKLDQCGQSEGFLTSFVNLCSIDINTDLNEYLNRVNEWITIFSDISLHTSGLVLSTKKITNDRNYNGIPFYNGLKLKFCYKGTDIGVANLFQVDCKNETVLVSDFGSSYERLLGCINGNNNFFKPLYPNVEILYGDYKKNDRIRTSVLMSLSGIVPGPHGVGQKLRNLIKEAICLSDGENIKNMISYYYGYYSKFINSNITLNQANNAIMTEVEYVKKKMITDGTGSQKNLQKSIDELCGIKIINDEISKRNGLFYENSQCIKR